ncbi:nuclear transcription factor Y subunit A-10-like protein isoform X1 [Tanacetum coccineum]
MPRYEVITISKLLISIFLLNSVITSVDSKQGDKECHTEAEKRGGCCEIRCQVKACMKTETILSKYYSWRRSLKYYNYIIWPTYIPSMPRLWKVGPSGNFRSLACDNAAAVAKTAHKWGCCKFKGFRHMPSDLYHVLHQRGYKSIKQSGNHGTGGSRFEERIKKLFFITDQSADIKAQPNHYAVLGPAESQGDLVAMMSFFATGEHDKHRIQYFASPEGRDDMYQYIQKEWTVLEGHVMMAFNLSTDDGPIFLNAKQYNGIFRSKRLCVIAKMAKKALRIRKPYMHLSRHIHAKRKATWVSEAFLKLKIWKMLKLEI